MPTLYDLHRLAHACIYRFPPPCDDAGLVGLGGDLLPSTLIYAYLNGLFPWFNKDEAIAWWNPNPRCVIFPSEYRPAKSLVRTAKKHKDWHISLTLDFDAVVHNCSLPRAYSDDTWIHDNIKQSYHLMKELGVGYSIEIWDGIPQQSELVGGLYGLKIGGCAFGESMFHKRTDASKLAFWGLNRLCLLTGVRMIDCQLPNEYLMGLGATLISRDLFLEKLAILTYPKSYHATATDWHTFELNSPLAWLYDDQNL